MNRLATTLVCAALTVLAPASPVLAAGIDDINDQPFSPFQNKHLLQQKPVTLPSNYTPNLADEIKPAAMPQAALNPIWLKGMNIAGLNPKSVEMLGYTYFVVVDNTKYLRMSDIYRDNRLAGKSNFVTTDSIVHPYLSLTNRILADVAVNDLSPKLRTLLEAMQKVALADYKFAGDAGVKRDIATNIAFLSVGLRLLNPKDEIPDIGDIQQQVEQDVFNIQKGATTSSSVFGGMQDFSVFEPVGWYKDSQALQQFYRCREWLSLVPFGITDSGSQNGYNPNSFRRSVLLFRSLDQANILGKPAMDTWNDIVQGYAMLGSAFENWHQKTLYPTDYKFVFQNQASDLGVTLQALAEPFFRTKLMLAVRNRKTRDLESESIFELSNSDPSSSAAVFRLFPMVGIPELPWLRGIAGLYPADKQAEDGWPISLLDMYVRGSPQAGNILTSRLDMLDARLAFLLPELQHCVTRRIASGALRPLDNRAWKILSCNFVAPSDHAPKVLQGDGWYSQRTLSSFGGWVDAQSTIAPAELQPATGDPSPAAAPDSAPPAGDTAGAHTAEGLGRMNAEDQRDQQPRKVHRIPPFHYLEPNLALYKQLKDDADKLQKDLDARHALPEKYRSRLSDFSRLFQRLIKIADLETKDQAISVVDRRLLGDIDQILDRVDVPLPAVLPIDSDMKAAEGTAATAGFNLAVGRPGMLFLIYQNPQTMEWTLGRGAVYTYYELGAPLLTQGMWQHRVEAGFAKPPGWAQKFELVQQPLTKPAASLVRNP